MASSEAGQQVDDGEVAIDWQAKFHDMTAKLEDIKGTLTASRTRVSATGDDDEDPFRYTAVNTDVEEIDIYPGGDVVFICEMADGKEVKLRVSSTVVALGSPVFKKMLGPHFREGCTLRTNVEVTIPLPDDDVSAMNFVLNTMHMRTPKDEVSPSGMVDIALVCDKYDCCEAIRPSIHAALEKLEHSSELLDFNSQPTGVGDALAAAVVMKDHKMIYKFGHSMLGHYTSEIRCSANSSFLFPMLGTDIFAQLETHRLFIRSNLCSAIESHLEQFSKWCDEMNQERGCPPPELFVGKFIGELRTARLWPAGQTSCYSLLDLTRAMKTFAPQTPNCARRDFNEGPFTTHTCGNQLMWRDSCEEIKDEGRRAEYSMNALHYPMDVDAQGNVVGFEINAAKRHELAMQMDFEGRSVKPIQPWQWEPRS